MTPPADLARKREQFIRRLVGITGEAARLDLWQTMHALNRAMFAVGYEAAGQKVPPYDNLKARSVQLEEALRGLRSYSNDGGCWCDTRDYGQEHHSPPCLKARAAVEGLDE